MAGGDRSGANDKLVVTLAGGASIQAAAKLCSVSERTIYRRLGEDAFRKRVAKARAEMVERALGHLSQGATEAAVTLRRLLRSGGEKTKLGAAKALLELGTKLRADVELSQRVAALEEYLASQQEQPR